MLKCAARSKFGFQGFQQAATLQMDPAAWNWKTWNNEMCWEERSVGTPYGRSCRRRDRRLWGFKAGSQIFPSLRFKKGECGLKKVSPSDQSTFSGFQCSACVFWITNCWRAEFSARAKFWVRRILIRRSDRLSGILEVFTSKPFEGNFQPRGLRRNCRFPLR